MAAAGGTLFIERASRRDAMRVVHQMATALKSGDMLAIFPEGTTGDGSVLLPFHANLIQAAISAHAPVMPVGLHVGEAPRAMSVLRALGAPAFPARGRFGQPQSAQGRDRRQWALDLHAAVDALCH